MTVVLVTFGSTGRPTYVVLSYDVTVFVTSARESRFSSCCDGSLESRIVGEWRWRVAER